MGTSFSLNDKTALITGASAGIGRATARTLAESGADVVLAARREKRLEELASDIESEYGVEVLVAPTDVTDETDIDALVTATVERFGTLDIVVNNAGTGTERDIGVEDLPSEQYHTVMKVNTDGMFFTTRATLPHLKESSGTIIFIGSFAAKYPRPQAPVYAATKWWTRGFALSLAGRIGDEGIGVTVINPSEVLTEFGKDFRADEALAKNRYDPERVTAPEVVADAAVYAASQEPPNTVTELDLYRRDKFVGL
jgi:NADP-dependent 3-hydroxy acid dehydrogenase YdfG